MCVCVTLSCGPLLEAVTVAAAEFDPLNFGSPTGRQARQAKSLGKLLGCPGDFVSRPRREGYGFRASYSGRTPPH